MASREQVLSRLASDEIASEQFERTVKHVVLHGNVCVVMGRETVIPKKPRTPQAILLIQ